jgi:hypothetical protein
VALAQGGGLFLAVAAARQPALHRPGLAPATAAWSTGCGRTAFHATRPLYWDTRSGSGRSGWARCPSSGTPASGRSGCSAAALAREAGPCGLEAKGALLCIAAILFNRIHSTQFHLWFYPFLILGS